MAERSIDIILASRNRNKIEELRQLIAPLGIKVKSLLDFNELEDIDETGLTLSENAFLKADYTYRMTGLTVIADDTGLEVDALNGEPGVYSARYAGNNATYKDNVNLLIERLRNCEHSEPFTARFKTIICLVTKNETYYFEGVCEGGIILMPRGENGFGYDPIFVPLGFDKTFAELDSNTKNRISHRGKAFKKCADFLTNIFSHF